jgi:uncharacterized protein
MIFREKSKRQRDFSLFKDNIPIRYGLMSVRKNDPLRLDISYLVKSSPGTHKDFDFDFPQLRLDDGFLLVNVTGTIGISVTEDGVVAEGKIKALTELDCSRCLDSYWQPLQIEFTEIFSAHPLKESDGDLGEQPLPADGSLDLAPIIRDYAMLDIPIRQVCKEDCEGLCPTCGVNRNQEDCGHVQEHIDPRMEGLRALLEKEEDQK